MHVLKSLLSIVFFASPAGADDIALNQVWSRLADINGELGSVESAEFSRDGQYIATGTKFDYTVRVFRVSDGFELLRVQLPQEIERVAWLADGQALASVSEDRMLRIIDAESGEVTFSYKHDEGIDALALSPDGRILATGQERRGKQGPVRLFDTADWSLIRTLDHGDTVNEIAWTPDGSTLISSGHGSVKIWDVVTGSLVRTHAIIKTNSPDQRDLFINAAVSPDGTLLAAGATLGYLYIYDLQSGELLRRLNKTGRKIETIAFTVDGRYLAQAGHQDTIDFFPVKYLLDPETNNDAVPFALRVPLTDALEHMEFNRQGSLFTTAHQDGTVQLWTYMSGDPNLNQRRHDEVRRIQSAAMEQDQ